jgi:spermidine/putrescine transport system permease protein
LGWGKSHGGSSLKFLKGYSFFLLLFLWAPLLAVVWKGCSFSAFEKLFSNQEILYAFGDSILLASVSSIMAVLLAMATAFSLSSLNPWMQRFVLSSLLLPLVLPEIAFGITYLVWFRKLEIPLGWVTLFLSHMAFSFCFVALTIKPAVQSVDFQIPQAAQDLGASPWQVFRHGIFPQILPALVAGFLMAFSLSLDDFLISFFVKGIDQITLPVKIYSMMRLKLGEEIYALSVLLFGFSVSSVVISQIWLKKSSS